MKKKTYNIEFSNRLREKMIQRGFASQTAACGVSPSALAKATGCFNEMALRYLDGRSIPNPDTILKISEWLQVEPGYLLFGDHGFKPPAQEEHSIKIDKEFLKYTLGKFCNFVKNIERTSPELVELYLNILTELSDMNMELSDLKRVFDLTMKSILISNDNGKSQQRNASKATS